MFEFQHPFAAGLREVTFARILTEEPLYGQEFSPEATDLIRKLLRKNPKERLGSKKGAEAVKADSFFQSINWDRLAVRGIRPPFIPKLVSI